MKKLEFKKYDNESATLETVGTVAEQVGAKGTAKFSKKNFNDDTKRVVVIAKDAKGESVVIACSTAVSASLRTAKAAGTDKNELLAQAINLPIYETEEGKFFIGFEAGEREEEKTIAELNKVKVGNKITSLADLSW